MDVTFKTRAVEMLGEKIDNVWSSDDLCQSNDSFFIASGVCSGWIPGVKFDGNKAIVTSKIIFGDSKESEIVTNEYINISKTLIPKKDLGMINAITDKYLSDKNIL